MDIDTADHVHHIPSGEDWVVAYVRGTALAWCGWPEGLAQLADCRLIRKASADERMALLRTMPSTDGARGRYARDALAASDPQRGSEERT